MIDFTIKVENEQVKTAFTNFIFQYKENIVDYMNQIVGNDGSPIDSGIEVKDGGITIYHIAPDKGFVLAKTPEGSAVPVQIMKYADVENNSLYILQEKGKNTLYIKQPKGEVDVIVGGFNSLNDVIKGIGSEQVKTEVATRLEKIETAKKTKEKDLQRLRRLGKAPLEVEEAQVVESTNE